MTPEEREAIAARAAQATPGPWVVAIENVAWEPAVPEPGVTRAPVYYQIVAERPEPGQNDIVGPFGYEGGGVYTQADAEFIAHARADVEALLAENARLREFTQMAIDAPLAYDTGDYYCVFCGESITEREQSADVSVTHAPDCATLRMAAFLAGAPEPTAEDGEEA